VFAGAEAPIPPANSIPIRIVWGVRWSLKSSRRRILGSGEVVEGEMHPLISAFEMHIAVPSAFVPIIRFTGLPISCGWIVFAGWKLYMVGLFSAQNT
jgi:hypothetical protein